MTIKYKYKTHSDSQSPVHRRRGCRCPARGTWTCRLLSVACWVPTDEALPHGIDQRPETPTRTKPSRYFESWPTHAAPMTTGQMRGFGWGAWWSWRQRGPAQGQGPGPADRLLLLVLLLVVSAYFDKILFLGIFLSAEQVPQNSKIRAKSGQPNTRRS